MRTYLMILLLAIIDGLNLAAEPVMTLPVANLSHNGQVTKFYGISALQDAHAAAVSGDVITLTSGTYNGCTITKSITLRGACMGTTPEMAEQGMRPTVINTEMHIKVPKTETNTLRLEDVCFFHYLHVDSVPHISLERVRVKYNLYTYGNSINFDATQCRFRSIMANASSSSTVYSFVNSSIAFIGTTYYLPSHINADHCVIGDFYKSYSSSYSCLFKNCIFTYYRNPLPSGCSAINCVAVNNNIFSGCAADNCKAVSMAELFDDQNTTYQYGDYVHPLTEEAALTYLGTDGSQVGIYGGILPFTMMPNNTIVTQCDISRKTSEDGKLKVQIEVKSIE